MEVIRSFTNDGNIYPSLFNLINTIKDNDKILHYKEHCLMHPGAMYNKSIQRIFSALNDLLDYMPNQSKIEKIGNTDELFKKTKEVIESIITFREDTFQIMKCLYHKNEVTKKEQFADKWLEIVNEADIKEYKGNIKFINNLNFINNKVKHENGRFTFFRFRAMGYFSAFGFFLDAVDNNGIKMPNERVHLKFKGLYTGYSYNYLVPLVLSFVYFISDYACLTIKKIIKDKYNELINVERIENRSTEVINLIDKIHQFTSKILLLDEYKRDFPQINFDNIELRFKYPADNNFMKEFIKYGNKYETAIILSGDGYTTQTKLPYM